MAEIKEIPLPKLVKPWSSGSIPNYAFINASVVDVETGTSHPNSTVLTSGGLIDKLALSKSIDFDRSKYSVIDCQGKWLCPGLIDCHVHIYAAPGELDLSAITTRSPKATQLLFNNVCNMMLSRGFTTVRDTGGLDSTVRDAISDDVIHGPRLYYAGMALSQTGGHGDFRGKDKEGYSCHCQFNVFGRICDGAPACLQAARDELRKGADFIKIMGGGGVASPADSLNQLQFTAEEIRAITTAANYAGTYVTAHAYTPEAIRHCIENGVRGIEHGNFIDKETAKLIAETNSFLTPTLITYKIMGSNQFSGFLSAHSQEKNSQVLDAGLKSLLIAKEAGVKVCYGSDLLGPLGGYQSGEFSIRSQVLTPLEILRQATVNPAEMLSENRLGKIEQGNEFCRHTSFTERPTQGHCNLGQSS